MGADWKYEPAHDHGLTWRERFRSIRREAGLFSSATSFAWRGLTRLYLRGVHRLGVDGAEHLPAAPPFVLAANHGSHLDTLVLSSALPRAMSWNAFPLAAGDTFFETPAVSAFASMFINALPVWRRSCGAHSLDELRRRLAEDHCIFILFPEGTRTRTGQIARFKPGIGRLVGGHAVPVVPCHLTGAWEALPPGRSLPRPRKISLRIGRPLDFSHLSKSRDDCRTIAADTEAAVRALATDSSP
ncbi:MAG: 1-acyl-sn-glycerol-3-phosphate acyltransferase [Akkermansiaceae bacterium]|nr:1-acyl-sn-glycerol-3-phosphate acyltransferase [Akkermansiaceae bacterium]